jgi:hypothetical protein
LEKGTRFGCLQECCVRPDPADPEDVSSVKLHDGETVRVRGIHTEVARKLLLEAA